MARPLRILHLTLGADAGGLSQYIVTLAAAMQQAGHEVAAAGDGGAWQWAFDAAPFPYVTIPLKDGLRGFLRSTRTLRGWLRERPVDVLHTHYRRATLLGRRLQSVACPPRAAAFCRRHPPILYTVHLSHISLRGPRRWFTDFGDHTHVPSVEARDWLTASARIPEARISVVPHGVDTARYARADAAARAEARAALGLDPTDRVAVFVGRLDDPKNEGWMLDLASAARARLPDLRVLLAGEGPHEPALRRRIADEGLERHVRLLGHCDPLRVYRAADALLLPSLREGFSFVCAEAMSVGVPVLRTRTSGTAELVVEGVTGRSTPIDREAFLAAAVAFLSDPEALRRMGEAAAAHVRARFTFDRQVAETLRLYESLCTMGATA